MTGYREILRHGLSLITSGLNVLGQSTTGTKVPPSVVTIIEDNLFFS